MTHPSATDAAAFRPAPVVRVPWARLVVGGALALGAAAMLAGVAIAAGLWRPGVDASRGLDLFALGFLAGVGPYALAVEVARRRRLALDARLPDFLMDLASLHKAGLTLRDSLLTAAEGDYGRLTRDVRVAADQARWNLPVLTALDNLRRRVGTPIATRTLTVVIEAGHSGGNVPEVLEIAASNARAFVDLREHRRRSMGVYTIITYVASLVFVGVALALDGIFVPRMIGAFSTGASGALSLARSLPSGDDFRLLFYVSALVQAIGNGLVGGVMAEGRVLAGLKHAWAMVAMCFVGFLLA